MMAPARATDSRAQPAFGLDLGLAVDAPAWRAAVPDIESRAGDVVRAAIIAVRAAARNDGASSSSNPSRAHMYEMGLVLSDDTRLAQLNAAYRGKEGPTNVLAFANADPPPDGAPWQLGDVIIAFGRAQDEAAAAGLTLAAHAVHLIVHGVLHLFGYDHGTDTDAARMEALEIQILSGLGIADPYRRDS